jgi:hypothetical protein
MIPGMDQTNRILTRQAAADTMIDRCAVTLARLTQLKNLNGLLDALVMLAGVSQGLL